MLKIGDFSKLARVSTKTLRHYDSMGLLLPARIDRFTGYRYYSLDQLSCLNRILALKDLGFSLEQIKILLRNGLSVVELCRMLKLKRTELQEHIQTEQARLSRLEGRLWQIESAGTLPAYEIVLKRIAPQWVIGIHDTIPTIDGLQALFEELDDCVHDIVPIQTALYPHIAIFYDDEFCERDIDVEVALPLVRPVQSRLRARVHRIPGEEVMACVVHHGTDESLGEAYDALFEWMLSSGYQRIGRFQEIHLGGQQSDMFAARQMIEVQVPVRLIVDVPGEQGPHLAEPQIVMEPGFTVAGIRFQDFNEDTALLDVWTDCIARLSKLGLAVTGPAYGVFSAENSSGNCEYVAGLLVDELSEIPSVALLRTVPAGEYAVMACAFDTLEETYEYMFQTWLPKSGYQWAGTLDFEGYDEVLSPADPESEFVIHIPIKEVINNV